MTREWEPSESDLHVLLHADTMLTEAESLFQHLMSEVRIKLGVPDEITVGIKDGKLVEKVKAVLPG